MEEVLIRDKEKLKNFEQVSAIIINDNQPSRYDWNIFVSIKFIIRYLPAAVAASIPTSKSDDIFISSLLF